jgi:hypothetical protein
MFRLSKWRYGPAVNVVKDRGKCGIYSCKSADNPHIPSNNGEGAVPGCSPCCEEEEEKGKCPQYKLEGFRHLQRTDKQDCREYSP